MLEFSSVNSAGGKRKNVKSLKGTFPKGVVVGLNLNDKDTVSFELKYDEQGPYAVVRKAKEEKQ